MRLLKNTRHFHNLPARFFGAKINSSAHCGCTQVPGIFYGAKHNLVKLIRVSKQFVVVHLYQKRYFVRILSCNGSQPAKGGGYGIAATLNGEAYNTLGVK